ncbi:MAG: hypothetical protein RLZZ127_870, partial [Planctomycetota bacterium]
MIRLLLGLASVAAAAEPAFLPPAAALGERVEAVSASGAAVQVEARPGRTEVGGAPVRMVPPGAGTGCAWDGWRLHQGGEAVLLVAPWRDPAQDRRWAWLPGGEPPRAGLLLAAPVPATDGAPVLPAQICAAQAIDPR